MYILVLRMHFIRHFSYFFCLEVFHVNKQYTLVSYFINLTILSFTNNNNNKTLNLSKTKQGRTHDTKLLIKSKVKVFSFYAKLKGFLICTLRLRRINGDSIKINNKPKMFFFFRNSFIEFCDFWQIYSSFTKHLCISHYLKLEI